MPDPSDLALPDAITGAVGLGRSIGRSSVPAGGVRSDSCLTGRRGRVV